MTNKNQLEEIKTIRKRTFQLELSDADTERLAIKAAQAGLTIEELLQNFIGDLVCGTYSNGSDERMYAQDWYDRCWFGSFAPTSSLLQHLARNNTIDDVFELRKQLRSLLGELVDEDLTEDERSEIESDIKNIRVKFAELCAPFTNPAERQKVIEWHDKLQQLISGESPF